MFDTLRKHRLDPEVERELDVIDLAVATGDTGRPEDAELTDFAMRLRGARVLPDPDEVARLDARAAHFGDGAGISPTKPRKLRPRNVALAGMATVCVLGMAGVTFATLNQGSDEISLIQPRALDMSESDRSGVAPEAATGERAMEKSLQSQSSADGVARVETRNTNLTLAAPVDDVESVSDDVIAVTDRYGGFVNSSRVNSGDSDADASLELMIPAAEYQAALAAISGLAHVRERVQNTEDITSSYRSAENSLDRAVKNRARLSRQRKAASTQAERDALTIRLRRAIRRVAAERQQFNALQRQASFVAMSVSIVGDDAAAKSEESTIGAAWRISKDLFTKIAGALIVVFAVLLPFVLVGLAGVLGVHAWRRRRDYGVLNAGSSGGSPAQPVKRNG